MTELRINNDVVQWAVNGRPASAEEAIAALANQPLLLLLHGFGSFEGDLIGLAPHLPSQFVCASPRAPLVAPPPIVNGHAWWPLALDANGMPLRQEGPKEFLKSGPHTAAVAIFEWLDALDKKVRDQGNSAGLKTVVPMGFSQGGCMVTSLMRMQPNRFVCGVNCSGFVAPGSFGGDEALAAVRPPLFWGRDEADPIIGEARISHTAEWAPAHTALEARLYDGILHGIGAEELEDISRFLEKHTPNLAGAAT